MGLKRFVSHTGLFFKAILLDSCARFKLIISEFDQHRWHCCNHSEGMTEKELRLLRTLISHGMKYFVSRKCTAPAYYLLGIWSKGGTQNETSEFFLRSIHCNL